MADTDTPKATKTGAYHGRLAFDPETNFHTDPEGNPVVSEDGGKSWRYAKADDLSHFDQYHERFADVDSTANRLAELQQKHGEDKAAELFKSDAANAHHFEPVADDPHYEQGATNKDGVVTHTRVTAVPNKKSVTLTGHTAAYEGGGK
jgi:hypothetical protein